MPIIKSAIKQMKQNRVKRDRNTARKRKTKEMVKTFETLVKEKKAPEAAEALKGAYKHIDLSTKKNLMHPNKAARKKSQLAKALAGLAK